MKNSALCGVFKKIFIIFVGEIIIHTIMKHPEEWSLTLLIGFDALYYRLEHDTLEPITGTAPFEQGAERLAAIENAVYDTPLLLDDYSATRVVVTTTHFALTPAELPAPLRNTILRTTLSAVNGDVVTSDTAWGVGFVFELPRGLRSFLDRTFLMPPVVPHLQPVVDYLHDHDDVAVLAHCGNGLLDLAIQREGTLQLANCYTCAGDNDALFYTLQACKATGVDALAARVALVGDDEACARLHKQLAEYFKDVTIVTADLPFTLHQQAS